MESNKQRRQIRELIEMLQFTQSAVYNRQYFYFEKTVNEFFKKINYSNNQNVFIGIPLLMET